MAVGDAAVWVMIGTSGPNDDLRSKESDPEWASTVNAPKSWASVGVSAWTSDARDQGEAVAKLNLWISVPALFLAFAIWQVWSVVAVGLPGLGFKYSTNQLFWLAAAPALSGATLRIFYSFIVPLVGGGLT